MDRPSCTVRSPQPAEKKQLGVPVPSAREPFTTNSSVPAAVVSAAGMTGGMTASAPETPVEVSATAEPEITEAASHTDREAPAFLRYGPRRPLF